MSDETKCAKCGHDRTEHNGPRAECDRCMCVLFVATPPTPDPRERGEETFEEWYERIRRERGGAAGPLDAMDADATQMLLAAYYDRAPAPSEAVAFVQETVDTLSKHLAWLDKEAKRADLRGGGHGQLVGHEPGAGYRKVAGAINDALHAYLATHPAPARGVTVGQRLAIRDAVYEALLYFGAHDLYTTAEYLKAATKVADALTPDAP